MEVWSRLFFLVFIMKTVHCDGDFQQTPAFTPEEKYLDIFPLSKENFTDNVLQTPDPWVVIFHEGTMTMAWKKAAVAARGLVWLGMVDKRIEPEFLNEIGYNPTTDSEGRVYPFGGVKMKKRNWKSVKNPNDARKAAVDSIPDLTVRMKGKDIQDFLVECFSLTPSKFPVVLLTDEKATSSLFKALAQRFQKYFNFGRFVQPTIEDYRALGIGLEDDTFDMPAILVLVPGNPKNSNDISFNAVQYDIKAMGPMTYPNVLQFFFAVNNQYRHLLPGKNQSNMKIEAEMEDVIKIESRRFDIIHLRGKYGKKTKDDENKFTDDGENIKFKSEVHRSSKKDEL